MEKKKIINGDVGQIVHGNSTPNTSTQNNSNVVNVTIGDKEQKVLTTFQRERITKQVKEYAALTGLASLEIYKDLLIIGGAKKMDLFPMDKYKEASEWLDRMIASARAEAERKLKPQPQPQLPTPIRVPTPSLSVARPCSKCQDLSTTLHHAHMKTYILAGLLFAVFVMQAWIYFDKSGAELAIPVIEKKCMNDGKTYSVGSALRMSDGVLRQCVGYVNLDSTWEPIKGRH